MRKLLTLIAVLTVGQSVTTAEHELDKVGRMLVQDAKAGRFVATEEVKGLASRALSGGLVSNFSKQQLPSEAAKASLRGEVLEDIISDTQKCIAFLKALDESGLDLNSRIAVLALLPEYEGA